MPHSNLETRLTRLPAMHSKDRINMGSLLEPSSRKHATKEVSVTPGQMEALKASNQAIDETWRTLSFGSGNQHRHVAASQGEAFKRTTLAYELKGQLDTGYTDPRYHDAFTAAYVQSGNCDQMADVSALLLSVSGINQQVAKAIAHDENGQPIHTFVTVGDDREPKELVVADAWPEFGRAMRYQDFSMRRNDAPIVQIYEPGYKPEVRAKLMDGPKASQAFVNKEFDKIFPSAPATAAALTRGLLAADDIHLYQQQHTSDSLGARYVSPGQPPVDQSLSKRQLNKRLTLSGLPLIK